jgi:hypothetical protein
LFRGELPEDSPGFLGPPLLVEIEIVGPRGVESFGEGLEGRPTLPLPGPIDEPTSSDHGNETPIAGLGRLKSVSALPDVEKHLLNRIFRVGGVNGPAAGQRPYHPTEPLHALSHGLLVSGRYSSE